jgi:hypothetical protein
MMRFILLIDDYYETCSKNKKKEREKNTINKI